MIKRPLFILLFDCSGSMENPFSGGGGFTGRTKQSQASIKLTAAKETAINEVNGFNDGSDIAIIKFNNLANQIYHGSVKNREQIFEKINDIKAGGKTNLAEALDQTLSFSEKYERICCVIISDGLSNVGDPVSSAQKSVDAGIEINIALIDGTQDGLNIAKKVAINGRIYVVASAKELNESLKEAGLRKEIGDERYKREAFQEEMESSFFNLQEKVIHDFRRLSKAYELRIDELQYLNQRFSQIDKILKKSGISELGDSPHFSLSSLIENSSQIPAYREQVLSLTDKIERLEKEIIELRKEKISTVDADILQSLGAISMGLNLSNIPTYKYFPIRVYLDGAEAVRVGGYIQKVIQEILKGLESEIIYEASPKIGSWFGWFIGKSRKKKLGTEFSELYEMLKEALEQEFIKKSQASSIQLSADGISKLAQGLKDIDNAVLQFGPILLLKVTDNNKASILVRQLSGIELEIIEANPELLMEPKTIFMNLKEKVNTHKLGKEIIDISNPKMEG